MACRPSLLAACLALLLLSPLALAVPPGRGPFHGLVAEGQWREHPYTNWPNPDFACPVYPWGAYRPYTVVLTYEPPTDRVDLVFKGMLATGSNGKAVLSFTASNCLGGTVWAHGVSVTAPYAAYQVAVHEGVPLDALRDLALA